MANDLDGLVGHWHLACDAGWLDAVAGDVNCQDGQVGREIGVDDFGHREALVGSCPNLDVPNPGNNVIVGDDIPCLV